MYDLRSISKSLQDAAKEILEAKKPIHPNQQKIDVHEPEKDEINAKDFEMLRAGKKAKMKEEVDQIDELSKETMSSYLQKRGSMVSPRSKNNKGNENMARAVNKIAKKTNEEVEELDELKMSTLRSYVDKAKAENLPGKGGNRGVALLTPGTRDKGVHRAVERMRKMKEDIDLEDDADEILLATPIVVDIKESYMFGDYLLAAKAIVGEEQAIELANYAYNKQDTSLFVEQITRSDIQSKIAAHTSAGHQVSEPKYKTKDGKLHAEYVVTDKETGIRRKYIHHGTSRKVENMGAKGKRDDE
jgi:hypothetical protein